MVDIQCEFFPFEISTGSDKTVNICRIEGRYTMISKPFFALDVICA
jgi:hypothetical protein